MRNNWRVVVVGVAIAALAMAACGDDDSDNADDTTTTEEATTTTVEETTTTGVAGPKLTVDPAEGLTDGQTITVSATGFEETARVKFGEGQVGINQCVDKGDATGSGDCNLGAIVVATVDAEGNVPPTEYAVAKGPFGANNVTCGVEGPCVISVGELVADADAQRTDAVEIAFAG